MMRALNRGQLNIQMALLFGLIGPDGSFCGRVAVRGAQAIVVIVVAIITIIIVILIVVVTIIISVPIIMALVLN